MNAADAWVTTANGFEGFHVVRYLGVVRGITVRSASALGNFSAGIQAFMGGNVQAYTELAENSRFEAYELMISHASQLGANAVIAMRYDATEGAQRAQSKWEDIFGSVAKLVSLLDAKELKALSICGSGCLCSRKMS